jgi:hypothetical protein
MQSLPEVDDRRVYDTPILRKLTPEQARRLLVGNACVGHQGAKTLLELIFPGPTELATQIEYDPNDETF